MPLAVLRVIVGREIVQPKPKGPLPFPELYVTDNWGSNPLAGLTAIGMDIVAVPVGVLTVNFSFMPLIAPPPLGNEMEGMVPDDEAEVLT